MTTQQFTQAEPVGGLFGRLSSSDSFFDTIKSTPESIKDYLEKCIKCLRIGKGTPPEIESAAFIAGQQMAIENLSFAELRQKYHIYPDKLDLRAEWIHAEIERLGWDWKWDQGSDDEKKATFTATKGGKTCTFTYTIELAKKCDLVRSGSGWTKNVPAQLRAAAIRGWSTMYCPSIKAGTKDDTEFSGSVELDSSQVSTSAISPPLSAPTTTTKQPERQTPPPAVVGQTTSPAPSQSTSATSSKSITLDSMTSSIEFAKRAFTGFAKEPKISTIGQLVKYTREELIARESMGETTVKNIEIELARHGFKLKESSPLVTDQSGNGSATDAESGTPEASTDAAALAARGLELAEDSDANHSDNDHGAAIAEIREICTDAKLKETAKAVMGERCGGKTSLADLSHLETQIVLVYLLAIQCGIPVEKIDNVCNLISSDPDPINRSSGNIADLKKRLGKN